MEIGRQIIKKIVLSDEKEKDAALASKESSFILSSDVQHALSQGQGPVPGRRSTSRDDPPPEQRGGCC